VIFPAKAAAAMADLKEAKIFLLESLVKWSGVEKSFVRSNAAPEIVLFIQMELMD
jgi:hypothetical protein